VKEFKENKDVIAKNCKMISSLELVSLERNKVYDDGVFDERQKKHRQDMTKVLTEAHEKISGTMRAMYQHFKQGPPEVQHEWAKFVERADKTLEDALRQTVKRSLQELSKAINGDARNEPQAIFNVHIQLQDSRLEYKPTMISLTEMVNVVSKEVIVLISCMPRLTAAPDLGSRQFIKKSTVKTLVFKPALSSVIASTTSAEAMVGQVPEDTVGSEIASLDLKGDNTLQQKIDIITAPGLDKENDSFKNKVFNDDDILKIFLQIMNGMRSSATELQKYLSYWDKYKLLWNQDKNAFIRRYAKADRPLSQYRIDIERHRDEQHKIHNEDISNTINFISIDTQRLKASLSDHCMQWVSKLTGLLNENAEAELRALKTMIMEHSQTLTRKPGNLNELGDSLKLLRQLQTESEQIEARFAPLQNQYNLLVEFEVPFQEQELTDLNELVPEWTAFKETMKESEVMLEKSKGNMKQNLQDSVASLSTQMEEARKESLENLPYKPDVGHRKAFDVIGEYEKKVENLRNQKNALKMGLDIFNIDAIDNQDMKALEKDLQLHNEIWKLAKDWDENWTVWKGDIFRDLQVLHVSHVVRLVAKT
jgi:dynein heavy chain